jgi:WD40 repeat protein
MMGMDTPICLAFSSNGALLVYEEDHGIRYLINRKTDKVDNLEVGLHGSVESHYSFSFDNTLLAGMSDSTKIVVVRLVDGVIIHQIKMNPLPPGVFRSQDPDYVMSLSPNNNLLAYATIRDEHEFHLRDLSRGGFSPLQPHSQSLQKGVRRGTKPPLSMTVKSPQIWSLGFSRDGRLLAVGTKNSVNFYNLSDYRQPQRIASYVTGGHVIEVAFAPKDAYLAIGVEGQGVLLLRPRDVKGGFAPLQQTFRGDCVPLNKLFHKSRGVLHAPSDPRTAAARPFP